MPGTFLTARWVNLAMFTFAVPPRLLADLCPAGVAPETRNGAAFASLVAFDFLDTKVLGVPWPGHRNFPEVNLRFYAQGARGDRGVVFVREMVPQPVTCALARWLYNEPYRRASISRDQRTGDGIIESEYRLTYRGSRNLFRVRALDAPYLPDEGSREHFFTQIPFGFGQTRGGKPLRYRVEHPPWRVYRVRDWDLKVDWGRLYGGRWAEFANAKPVNVLFAEGSAVAVYPYKKEAEAGTEEGEAPTE